MADILAGQNANAADLPAADLAEVEPTAEDLAVIEQLADFERTEERIASTLTQLATYGAVDQVATRRFRREVRAELAALAALDTDTATEQEVSA